MTLGLTSVVEGSLKKSQTFILFFKMIFNYIYISNKAIVKPYMHLLVVAEHTKANHQQWLRINKTKLQIQ